MLALRHQKLLGINNSIPESGHFSLPPNFLYALEAKRILYLRAKVRAQESFKPWTKLPRDFLLLTKEK